MKKVTEVIGIFILSILYCYISAVSLSYIHSDYSLEADFDNSKYILPADFNTISFALEPHSYYSFLNFSISSDKKISLAFFSVIQEINESYLLNVFTQYHFISENFLIRFRKANLIYPFHDFF